MSGTLLDLEPDIRDLRRLALLAKQQLFPEWELEEMIREVIMSTFRGDIAEAAIAWLDRKIATRH
jgi:hypothetical protein